MSDSDIPDTIPPFNTPIPKTYRELLDILDDKALTLSVSLLDHERIEQATTCIDILQSNRPHTLNLMAVISDLEALGVKGWVESLIEKRNHNNDDELEMELDMAGRQAEGLEEEVHELKEQIEKDEELLKMRVAEDEKLLMKRIAEDERRLGKKTHASATVGLWRPTNSENQGKQRDRDQDSYTVEMQDIRSRLAQLEVQFMDLHQLVRIKEDTFRVEAHTRLPESPNERRINDDSTQTEESDGGYFKDSHELREPMFQRQSQSESSVFVEVDSLDYWDNDAITNDSTDGARIDSHVIDKSRAEMLHEVEKTLWYQEQRDSEVSHSFARRSLDRKFSPLTAPPVVSSTNTVVPELYIYVPLPANFTIPQHNIPSITFASPSSVFHFPYGANRDQLFAALRKERDAGTLVADIEPFEDLNVIRIRTHDMEWELKNAIRKSMTREKWDKEIGVEWYTEGEGDTYVVHKSDIHFSGGDESEGTKGGGNSTGDWHDRQHLRGGAGSPISSPACCPMHDPPNDIYDSTEVTDDITVEESVSDQTWIEYADILKHEFTAQVSTINRLNEIIKDLEETLEWQDERMAIMHHNTSEWKRMMKKSSEAVSIAKAETEAQRQESAILKMEIMQVQEVMEYNYHIYDSAEERLKALQWYLLAMQERLGLDSIAGIRGGGDHPQYPSSSVTTSEIDTGSNGSNIRATSFHFFPSVSTIVLLDRPVRYLQWPSGTTLEQIYKSLQTRNERGTEENANFHRIREILEIREELGIPLPDTSQGKQVFISLPEIPSDHDTRESAEKTSMWEKSFGPDEYERLFQGGMQYVDVPRNTNETHSSPTNSASSERFEEIGDLVNHINRVESLANISRRLDSTSNVAGVDEWSGNNYTPTERATRDLDQHREKLTLAQEPTDYTSSVVSTYDDESEQSSVPPAPTKVNNESAPRRLHLSQENTTKSAVPQLSSHLHPHPARMPNGQVWNVLYPPPKAGKEPIDELTRSANFDYELWQGRSVSSINNEKDKGRQWEKVKHGKGEGCESWIPWHNLDAGRLVCSFCGLPFAEGPIQTSSQDSLNESGADTPLTMLTRSSPKKGEHHSDEEEGQKSTERTPKRDPNFYPTTFDPYLRGGAATKYEAETWPTNHELYDSHAPFKRPGTPYYYSKDRAKDLNTSHQDHDINVDHYPPPDHSPVSTRFPSEGRNPVPSSPPLLNRIPKQSFSRPGDTAPPNSPTRLLSSAPTQPLKGYSYPSERPHTHGEITGFGRRATAERLYSGYALREKMFVKTMDLNMMRDRKGASTIKIKIPQTSLEQRRWDVGDEYAKRVFKRFMRGRATRENLDKGPVSLSSPKQCEDKEHKASDEIEHVAKCETEVEDTEVCEGPWVPETVAGPSERRRVRREDKVEEYDGMIWGSY
ncbi:hypothetical protein P280DRAFT_502854 [Massarina eburnea CBS 473.64]|uniref:Uncharacterized protein n=1 Tax=Massarina eburnea CBS 473.64 TaxID=1395130 RepID=A0A6A6SE84_9PLEO|nr:hypothetical protein P280DRAFT_502854 [Massarina eburnea CBS 473.64]